MAMNVMMSADGVLARDGEVLLVRRNYEPFQGEWALPGGMLEPGETLEECVVREIREETGLDAAVDRLVGVYSDPDRDPRGRTVTAAYVLATDDTRTTASSEVQDISWFPLDDLPELAFDHGTILQDYQEMRG